MTLRMGIFAALFAAFAAPASALPLEITFNNNGGDGSATWTEPAGLDLHVEITGSDNGRFGFGGAVETIVRFLYTGATSFTLFADWTFGNADDPQMEIFGYYVGDAFTDVSNQYEHNQSGSLSFFVNPGSTFAFYIYSVDNFNGASSATVTIADGVFPVETPNPMPSPVPLPASAAFMLPALGALGLLRRKAKAKA